MTLERVTDVGSLLGEGPLWNEPEHTPRRSIQWAA
jgi:hypothetical protein